MATKSTKKMSREQWLEERKSTIGSSDVAAILGLSKYQTPFQLYQEKVGEVEPESENAAMEWGTELEQFLADMFVKRHPGLQVKRDHKVRTHFNYGWATCNLDRIVRSPGALPVILELKTATEWAVKNWDAEVPTAYYAQVQWQMFVTDIHHAIIWVGVLDSRRFIELSIAYDSEFIQKMWGLVVSFQEAVVARDPSHIQLFQTDIERIRPEEGSRKQANDEIIKAVFHLRKTQLEIAELEKYERGLKDRLRNFLGENEALVDGDSVLATYKLIKKDAYTAPASAYRVLKITRNKKRDE
jgi:putative phage-type endonuclease